MLGLKPGVVQLQEHQPEWASIAQEATQKLQALLGEIAIDIQHIGSTSITHIKAKPIIDLAIAVENFDEIRRLFPKLEAAGFYHVPELDQDWQLFLGCNVGNSDTRTHHIHIVRNGGKEWKEYIKFRDYLNESKEDALNYQELKIELQSKFSHNRAAYTEGKAEFIRRLLNL